MSFLAITVIPVAVLAWLTWRIVEQDRALATQTVRDRIEHSADVVVAELERDLADLEDRLTMSTSGWTDEAGGHALLVTFAGDRVETDPRGLLPYYPVMSPAPESVPNVLAPGEDLEFRQHYLTASIAAYREHSRSPNLTVRGEALLRLARVLRKAGQHHDALDAYDELAKLGTLSIAGAPAELVALDARGSLLEALGRSKDLEQSAESISAGLSQRRWRLDRASFVFYSTRAREWLGERSIAPHGDLFADAIGQLWNEWRNTSRGAPVARQRLTRWVGDSAVLVLWRGSRDSLRALVARPRFLEKRYGKSWQKLGSRVALVDGEGRLVLGAPASSGVPSAVRGAGESRLPWTVRVTSVDTSAELAQLAGRRGLLLSGLGLTALLIVFGGYLTVRATARELAVARLQSDFVAAVSHEFRTPLTSLRHLTELLESGAVESEERRRQYFAMLSSETERLHRMVEGLLEFGRIEAGRRQYAFDTVDPVALVEGAVSEFRREIEPAGHRVELNNHGVQQAAHQVRVDQEAIRRAIRNLLENAVKYSPAPAPVVIELSRKSTHVAISIRDEGVGIPRAEQDSIFEKFVRGSAASSLNVKGTGVGLSMVKHIVQAHGGDIRLTSEPGRGSTFTMLLPMAESAVGGGLPHDRQL